jgi:hypothetical protein
MLRPLRFQPIERLLAVPGIDRTAQPARSEHKLRPAERELQASNEHRVETAGSESAALDRWGVRRRTLHRTGSKARHRTLEASRRKVGNREATGRCSHDSPHGDGGPGPQDGKLLDSERGRDSGMKVATENHSPWMAAIAESFRSTCGSERGAPECSTQRSPTATPHVGQGTETSCAGVSSFFFTSGRYSKAGQKSCPIWNTAIQETTRDKPILITHTVRQLPPRNYRTTPTEFKVRAK